MAYEHKDETGTLFKNTKKNENSPDWRGNGKINGVQVKISAWEKRKDGKTWLSLSFQNEPILEVDHFEDKTTKRLDDDIPF